MQRLNRAKLSAALAVLHRIARTITSANPHPASLRFRAVVQTTIVANHASFYRALQSLGAGTTTAPSRCPRSVVPLPTPGTSACRWCLVSGGELRRPLAKTNEFSYRLNGIHIDLNSAIIVRANVEARFDRLTRSGSNPRLWSPAAKRTLTRLSMSLRQDHQPQ